MRLLICVILSGCALEPNSLRVEATHTSHILQHIDGTSETNRHEFDLVGGSAHWQSHGAYLNIGEYFCPEGLDNRHEVFQATLGYEWKLHD